MSILLHTHASQKPHPEGFVDVLLPGKECLHTVIDGVKDCFSVNFPLDLLSKVNLESFSWRSPPFCFSEKWFVLELERTGKGPIHTHLCFSTPAKEYVKKCTSFKFDEIIYDCEIECKWTFKDKDNQIRHGHLFRSNEWLANPLLDRKLSWGSFFNEKEIESFDGSHLNFFVRIKRGSASLSLRVIDESDLLHASDMTHGLNINVHQTSSIPTHHFCSLRNQPLANTRDRVSLALHGRLLPPAMDQATKLKLSQKNQLWHFTLHSIPDLIHLDPNEIEEAEDVCKNGETTIFGITRGDRLTTNNSILMYHRRPNMYDEKANSIDSRLLFVKYSIPNRDEIRFCGSIVFRTDSSAKSIFQRLSSMVRNRLEIDLSITIDEKKWKIIWIREKCCKNHHHSLSKILNSGDILVAVVVPTHANESSIEQEKLKVERKLERFPCDSVQYYEHEWYTSGSVKNDIHTMQKIQSIRCQREFQHAASILGIRGLTSDMKSVKIKYDINGLNNGINQIEKEFNSLPYFSAYYPLPSDNLIEGKEEINEEIDEDDSWIDEEAKQTQKKQQPKQKKRCIESRPIVRLPDGPISTIVVSVSTDEKAKEFVREFKMNWTSNQDRDIVFAFHDGWKKKTLQGTNFFLLSQSTKTLFGPYSIRHIQMETKRKLVLHMNIPQHRKWMNDTTKETWIKVEPSLDSDKQPPVVFLQHNLWRNLHPQCPKVRMLTLDVVFRPCKKVEEYLEEEKDKIIFDQRAFFDSYQRFL